MTGSDRAAHAETADQRSGLTLGDVARDCPRWHCWNGVSALVYARLAGASPPVIVCGENPAGLREKIRRAEADL